MAAIKIPISSYYVAKSIDLAQFAERTPYPLLQKTRNHFLFRVEGESWFLMYSFGVVVTVNLAPDFLKQLLTKKVKQCCAAFVEPKYIENFQIIEDASFEKEIVDFESMKVKELTLSKIEIISEILAQSVAIDYFDGQVDNVLNKFSFFTTELETRGRIRASTKHVTQLIGKDYSILESMIVRLSLLDKPDIVWDDPSLENLFLSLRSMFELEDRFTSLDYKLRFIQSNSELMLEILRARRDQSLEIIIVVLIIIEILLFVYELFGK